MCRFLTLFVSVYLQVAAIALCLLACAAAQSSPIRADAAVGKNLSASAVNRLLHADIICILLQMFLRRTVGNRRTLQRNSVNNNRLTQELAHMHAKTRPNAEISQARSSCSFLLKLRLCWWQHLLLQLPPMAMPR